MAIDKTVSSNAAERNRAFTFTKTKGKGDDAEVIATFHLTGLKLKKVGDSMKIDPQDSGNIASFKAVIGDFPQFAGALLNTHMPVFLRGKLNDGFRGTLRQAVEAACSGGAVDNRSSKAQMIAGELKADPEFEASDLTKKAWKKRGFDAPPTAAEIESVRNGDDPWSEDGDE